MFANLLNGMQNPLEVPFRKQPDLSICNNSMAKVSGWIQRQPPVSMRETFILLPCQITAPNSICRTHRERFLASLHVSNDIYHLNVRNYCLSLYRESEPLNVEGKWQIKSFLVQMIPLLYVRQMASVIVKDDGKAVLFVPGYQPQDDRPKAQLEAYKELTGYRAYTTPECILGLDDKYSVKDIKNAYQGFLPRWKEQHSRSAHSVDIFKLVVWARNELEKRHAHLNGFKS